MTANAQLISAGTHVLVLIEVSLLNCIAVLYARVGEELYELAQLPPHDISIYVDYDLCLALARWEYMDGYWQYG